MKSLGRTLQVLGLILLPVAILLEATGTLGRESGVADMVWMMVSGLAAFYIGRILEGYART